MDEKYLLISPHQYIHLFPWLKQNLDSCEVDDDLEEYIDPVEDMLLELVEEGEWNKDKKSSYIGDRLWLISNSKLSIVVRDLGNQEKVEYVAVKLEEDGGKIVFKPVTYREHDKVTQYLKEIFSYSLEVDDHVYTR